MLQRKAETVMNKAFVFGLDGMPYSLFKYLMEKNRIPNIASLMKGYQLKEIESVIPVVSSVAWTSYSTSADPSTHGIYGFVERESNPFRLRIPLSYDIKKPTIWEELSEYQKKTAVINVPITYPAYQVNGVLVSCFLCPDISKAAYPSAFSKRLMDIGYIIDADASLAVKSKPEFLENILSALEKRFAAANEILLMKEWDYFHLHIMETDRLMHFFWYDIFNLNSPFHGRIMYFFQRLDELLADMLKKIPEEAASLLLSDHGFCGIKYEVQINKWLEKEGLLKLNNRNSLDNICGDSICYSLLPGRIYINLKGREENGCVDKEEYSKVCAQVMDRLKKLICPYTGEQVIDKVFLRDDLYRGAYEDRSADITLLPRDGYDLKGATGDVDIFSRSELTGMHTLKNALLCGKNIDISSINNICQITPFIKRHVMGG